MEWKKEFKPLSIKRNKALDDLIIVELSSWGAIIASGDDRKSYLQGQLTCDVVTLPSDASTLGAHCDAKGKVWSTFRLFHHQQGYALFQHASAIERSLAEIKKYAVFSKVDLSISKQLALGVVGTKAEQLIERLSVDRLSEARGDVRAISGGSAIRIEPMRWILLIDEVAARALIDSEPTALLADHTLWDKYEIEAGLPRITSDHQNEHIPQALNLQYLGGISFSKGCYTGQETVARAKYRGTNKRALFIVKGSLNQPVSEPIQLERQVGENWRAAGKLIAHYRDEDGSSLGLIILPNDLDPATPLRLNQQSNQTWSIQPLPYSIEEM
jgi:folate-binding protein YgfZ